MKAGGLGASELEISRKGDAPCNGLTGLGEIPEEEALSADPANADIPRLCPPMEFAPEDEKIPEAEVPVGIGAEKDELLRENPPEDTPPNAEVFEERDPKDKGAVEVKGKPPPFAGEGGTEICMESPN